MKLLILSLLPAFAIGQIRITPAAPVAAVGKSIGITADRPVTFRLSGAGALSVVKGSTVTYTAPAAIAATPTLAGCMTTPADSVFNTRVDGLPVHPGSGSWTPFVAANGLSFSFGWGINIVDQTTPVAAQQFAQTPQLNGVPFPVLSALAQKRENGSLTTDARVDHHLLLVNQSTCQFYETNQSGISIDSCPTCTAQSGWTYKSTDYQQPAGPSADSAGLPLAPLTLHLSELQNAAITHALRFTACAECVGTQATWPALSSPGLQPGAPPMGARFRLKASVDISAFPPYAGAVLTALKRYGMILAGVGPNGQISVASDVTENRAIYQQLQSIDAANLSYTDFEAVDESSLQLAAGSYAVNPANRFAKPNNYATLTVIDAADARNTLTVPIALQPVAIGTPDPAMVVQGGAATFQIPHWVTGTTNTSTSWSISPVTGAGVITGDGFYTPPVVVTAAQTGIVVQGVSAADPSVRTRVYLTLVPNGGIRIDTGSNTGSQDAAGLAWLPDTGMESGTFTAVNDAAGNWGAAAAAQALSSYSYTAGGDIVYKLHVPNGNYQVSLSFGVGDCEGKYSPEIPNQDAVWGPLHLQSQNTLPYQNWLFSLPVFSACRTADTANLSAQVTNGILTFGVRAATVNGRNSAALLNSVSILPVPQQITNSIRTLTITSPASATYTPQQFDPACGQPGYDCHNAFQLAFATLAQAGGGTLQLPAGTFTINFAGVPQNILDGAPLARKSLLVVPANTVIQGHLAANGTSDSIIKWQNTSIPVFVFDQASHSGLRNLHLSFTGTMPKAFPYGDIMLLKALGYNPTFPHQNQMSGGNGELFAFAYVFNSDYCIFDHLLFDSATHDNDHTFAVAINIKGKGVVTTNGGGLTQLAQSNQITNLQVYDFNMGFLVGGQNNFLMQNITADRRGSAPDSAPGHLLYTIATNLWDANGQLLNLLLSTNAIIQNISEGPNTYSNASAGGTLAIKCLNGAQINNVTSQHPEGLIQTIYMAQNVTFSNMSWTSHYPLCANVPANCSTPAIYTASSPADLPPTKNLTFQNISLVSTASPTNVVLMGDNLQVNGLLINTPADFLPGQQAMNSILNVSRTNRATITGYTYTPVLTTYNAKQKYNSPFTGWNPSTNVTAAVTINWPKTIPVPASGSIITPGFQTSGPSYNNQVTGTIKLN